MTNKDTRKQEKSQRSSRGRKAKTDAARPSSKEEPKKNDKEASQKDVIPRRCVAIRRTLPKEGVEKTELRFVVYRNPTDKFDQHAFLDEVNHFLKEQADGKPSVPEASPASSKEPSTVSERSLLESELSEAANGPPVLPKGVKPYVRDEEHFRHHEKECQRADSLRKSIPLIKSLIDYFTNLEKRYKRKEIEAMRLTAEQVLRDTNSVLKTGGPIGKGLLYRIKSLTQMSQGITNISSNSSAMMSSSNVNACSAVSDSSLATRK